VGKSTLTTNLAVNMKGLILDTDPQATCADWGDSRTAKFPEIITVPPKRISAAIANRTDKWVFVDTQPSVEASLIEVAKTSDLCIIVLAPYQFELNALGETVSVLKVINANAVFCVNRAHPKAKLDELINELKEHYPVGPIVRERGEFKNAAAQGKGVTEIASNGNKALNELKTFSKWIKTYA
jgi:chromosome partitioning protein